MQDSLTPRQSTRLGAIVFRPLPLQRESAFFLLVSVLDVMMTYLLLKGSADVDGPVVFYESNPVARFFFNNWNVRGIVAFKFSMVALVEVIAHIVALNRLPLGRRVLEFGTLAVSTVVIYSFLLMLSYR